MHYCDVTTNSRWRTAANLKIAKSPYLSEKSSDFDKIWYTKADILNPTTITWTKLNFLKFKMASAAILKIAFLVITHQPIVRFQRHFVRGSRTACRQVLHDKNCKFVKSKMADGRHFENRKIAIISVKNRQILMKFGTLKQILNPMTVTWPKIIIIF